MACGGHRLTLIVPLVLGYKTMELGEIHEEPRRDDVIDVLEVEAKRFLATLERGELPPPDDSLSSYTALQAITDLDDVTLELDGEAGIYLERWRMLQGAVATGNAAEKELKLIKAWFAARAGTADKIRVGDAVLSRKKIEVKAHDRAASSYWKWDIAK